jgi:hypothetical protein
MCSHLRVIDYLDLQISYSLINSDILKILQSFNLNVKNVSSGDHGILQLLYKLL